MNPAGRSSRMLFQCKLFLFNPWLQCALHRSLGDYWSPLQVFHIINSTRWVYTFWQPAACRKVCDEWMWWVWQVYGLQSVFGTKSAQQCQRNVTTEPQLSFSLRNCSYNAMVLPSETRDNASKQLYWRLKRLGLESTPSNNNNYNNNYMFIYTIYRLKNTML